MEGWLCPNCQRGTLKLDKKNILTVHYTETYDLTGDIETIEVHRSIIFNCTDSKCEKRVICIAKGHVSIEDVLIDEDTGETDYQPVDKLSPLFFSPHLKIFRVPKGTPEAVDKYLNASFQVFFCNPDSALSNLRASLEELLNFLKIQKLKTKNGKKFRMSLHVRINSMKSSLKEIQNLCFAIKWHGNAGSHPRSNITHDDVLDAYSIFEVILEKLFETKYKDVEKLAKTINKQKGVAKKKKKVRKV